MISQLLSKFARRFFFSLIALCLLGGCKEKKEVEDVFNEVAMYEVEAVEDCNPGLILHHYNCTKFYLEDGLLVCHVEGYNEDFDLQPGPNPLRIMPGIGCQWYEPMAKANY